MRLRRRVPAPGAERRLPLTVQPQASGAAQAQADPPPAVQNLDTIVSLAKRRGFVFPSSEIYGGINAVWDYGPLGVELKNNVKRAWWRAMVQERDDIVGLDAGILMHPQVWVTSGHVESFSDPLVECATDKRRFRLDELPGTENLSETDKRDPHIVERLGLKCPVDGGPLSPPRRFNLMFRTFMGPVEDEGAVVYLRPETAQGSYVNFKNVQGSTRKKLPFGIAQVGKSFRNEISPGNFVFRMREFEQMEMQYFVAPEDAARIFEEWLPRRWDWYTDYGVDPTRLRFREHAPDELAHYAKKATDIEYRFPFGWKELEGIHNRGDWDLGRHQKESGENLEYFDPATERSFVPWIVETAGGPDRAAFTFLIDSYREEEVRGEKRVSLALHPQLAPYKVAVLPLLKKRPEIVALCRRIVRDLRADMMAVYDDTASIGKLYRRQDEIGTPWCITVDVDSLDDGAVTVRDRDSMAQDRVPVEGVKRLIVDRLEESRPDIAG
jgi:glycyl-tRNA synthetase